MRYELITIGAHFDLVLDTTDNTRKWVTPEELLEDIFNDPLFADIH